MYSESTVFKNICPKNLENEQAGKTKQNLNLNLLVEETKILNELNINGYNVTAANLNSDDELNKVCEYQDFFEELYD